MKFYENKAGMKKLAELMALYGGTIPPLVKLDTDTAAAYLAVSPNHLCNLRSQGRGPKPTRVGKFAVRYTMRELLSFEESLNK